MILSFYVTGRIDVVFSCGCTAVVIVTAHKNAATLATKVEYSVATSQPCPSHPHASLEDEAIQIVRDMYEDVERKDISDEIIVTSLLFHDQVDIDHPPKTAADNTKAI